MLALRSSVVAALLAVTAGCASPDGPGQAAGDGGRAARPATAATEVVLPEANVGWDYQIGGAFRPAAGVGVVSRDRRDPPSPGDYSICYVNAFQTQPDEAASWRRNPDRWALVLKDARGRPVVDGAWGEWLLDTRTAATRAALLDIVGRWVDRCAADGFRAVEPDNLDSWDRSRGLIVRSHNIAFARLLTRRAHADGLAVAQKNWAELSPRGPSLGFDFAVAEQCADFHECAAYAGSYDDRVYAVEYDDRHYAAACRGWGARLSIVRRDLAVSPRGVDRRC